MNFGEGRGEQVTTIYHVRVSKTEARRALDSAGLMGAVVAWGAGACPDAPK